MIDFEKRISIFSGHFGSGKTNVAVNFALKLKSLNKSVKVFDLDIVNPYFRTQDAKEMLENKNIELVASPYANSNVDIPSITCDMNAITDQKYNYAVADVGGDDRGALALGRYEKEINLENNFNMFLVLNMYRPETSTVEDVKQIKNEIENACKIKFNGIINNSNLGKETTEKTILNSIDFAKKCEKELNLKLKFTCVENKLFANLKNKIENLLPLNIIKYGDWE